MKITKERLRQVIKEELQAVSREGDFGHDKTKLKEVSGLDQRQFKNVETEFLEIAKNIFNKFAPASLQRVVDYGEGSVKSETIKAVEAFLNLRKVMEVEPISAEEAAANRRHQDDINRGYDRRRDYSD